jgi:ABC-type nitrate/sulfonate/bicarbonate transport system permease component
VNTTSASSTEQAKRAVANREVGSRLIGIGLVALWLLLWEWIVRFGLGEKFFSSPSSIVAFLYQSLLVTGELRTPLFATVTRLLGGFMIGVVPALSLGFIMGRNRRAWFYCAPFFAVLGLIPTLAALPWFIIMFGVRDFGKWMIVAAAVFYPVLYCTTKGVQISCGVKDRSSPSEAALQQSNWAYGAGPWIFTGLKLGMIIGLATLLGAEMFASRTGLGFEVAITLTRFDFTRGYAAMLAAALVVYVLWLCLNSLELAFSRKITFGFDQAARAI